MIVSALLLLFSCSTTNQAPVESKSNCPIQAQNSVSLTSIRYISILEAIKNGDVDQASEDMDWWIDQAIIELMYLEESNPGKKIEENPVSDSLRYKKIYNNIARYRVKNPRIHKVPLDNQQMKMIETFVNNYK
jgi:hypothetical protein